MEKMTERKWTKGPWVITDVGTLISDGGNVNNPIEVAGLNIAHFSRYECKTHQSANAHLIAAAPDLYEALSLILRDNDIDITHGAYEALAKARGETQ
jgi:hypothetical protein